MVCGVLDVVDVEVGLIDHLEGVSSLGLAVVVHVDYNGRIGLYLGFGLIWDVGLRFIAAAGSEGQWEQGQE